MWLRGGERASSAWTAATPQGWTEPAPPFPAGRSVPSPSQSTERRQGQGRRAGLPTALLWILTPPMNLLHRFPSRWCLLFLIFRDNFPKFSWHYRGELTLLPGSSALANGPVTPPTLQPSPHSVLSTSHGPLEIRHLDA